MSTPSANVEDRDGPATALPAPDRWLRRLPRRLASLGDTPHRTALAFGLGVFLSFSPFLGFQIAFGVAAALLFRLHRVAVLAGLCTNLPIITIPYYAAATAAGAAIMGSAVAHDTGARLANVLSLPVYQSVFWERAVDLLAPFFVAFLLGSTLGAIALGLSAYVAVRPVLASLERANVPEGS